MTNAIKIWRKLTNRYGDIHATLLPDLNNRWQEIRLLDFKSVGDYYEEVLKIKTQYEFCEIFLTNKDLIGKTLQTFPASARYQATNYRHDYHDRKITSFEQVMLRLVLDEKHEKVLLKNNERLVGTKRISETNYGRAPKKPHINNKGQQPNNQKGPRKPNKRGKRGSGKSHVWNREPPAGKAAGPSISESRTPAENSDGSRP